MKDNLDISHLISFGLKTAEKQGADFAEIFCLTTKYINIDIEENSVKNNEIGSDQGICIRILNSKGSLGFAFTNRLKKTYIQKMVKKAITLMNIGTVDTDFRDLPPNYVSYPTVNQLYDFDVKNLTLEDSVQYAQILIDICAQEEMAVSQSGNFSSSKIKTYISNTNGLNVSSRSTICSISSHVILKDKTTKDMSFGFESQIERNLKAIKAHNIVLTAIKNAKRNLNRKKIKSRQLPLILSPKGVINLILRPLASAINAETFQYERSFLVGRRGKEIGSKHLNIEDNALIDGAVGSSIFDGEGVPCKNKNIIENGKFLKSGLLHNSYTAGKEGIESTGNASRNSYTSLPSIGISNFIFKPGVYTKDEIIEDTKEAIFLDYTGDRPNLSTGDFSGLILQGNLIKNGEISHPLNETMVGVNLLDLFKKIEAVSEEFKTYGPFQAPYIKLSDVQIIGSAS